MRSIDWAYEIPYVAGGRNERGADCWGLVLLFYKRHFKIDIPTYDWVVPDQETFHKTTCEQATVMAEGIEIFREVDTPKQGDIILLNVIGMPIHVGILIGANLMLHTGLGHGVVVENIAEMKWRRRIKSYHRHINFK